MKIDIEQSALKGGQKISRALLRRIEKALQNSVPKLKKTEVSLVFVKTDEIRRLNRSYRKKAKVTDVLSFEMGEGGVLGEVVICYEQAKKQAKARGVSTRKETTELIVHGILHLAGYDHESEKEEKIMLKLQKKIISKI